MKFKKQNNKKIKTEEENLTPDENLAVTRVLKQLDNWNDNSVNLEEFVFYVRENKRLARSLNIRGDVSLKGIIYSVYMFDFNISYISFYIYNNRCYNIGWKVLSI